jgi:nucleotidyltransferase substrate binding protein (TIGR01987 family)
MRALNFDSLQRALARLEEGLQRYNRDPSDLQIRDGLIQRFEFTYEAAHRAVKRYLESTSADPTFVDQMTFSELIRTANEVGLVRGDWPTWRSYREMRARTSHTYDEVNALAVVAGLPGFIEEIGALVDELTTRITS